MLSPVHNGYIIIFYNLKQGNRKLGILPYQEFVGLHDFMFQ